MANVLRRSLASLASSSAGPSTLPLHLPSVAGTLPTAVRKRRSEYPPHSSSSPSPLSDPAFIRGRPTKALPAPLEAEFQALRSKGKFKGDEVSGRRAFLNGQVAWRSRVRGVRGRKADHMAATSEAGEEGEVETGTEVIGQRIYLPNIQIRLMRNHTAPGVAYDPMIATFRIPQSMTKTDLRGYLGAVYNLPTTFIRTDNYIAPVKRVPGGRIERIGGERKTYKRAVVGLTEPFHYPDDVEEMTAQGQTELAEERKKWIDDRFSVERMKEYRKKALMKFWKGYRWRGQTHDNGGNAIRDIMKKRKAKEAELEAAVKGLRSEEVVRA